MRISAFHELDWTLLKINLYCSSQGVPEPLSSRLHDDLIPQLQRASVETGRNGDVEQLEHRRRQVEHVPSLDRPTSRDTRPMRSEEHTSELQSPCNLVCRLLLEKKKKHHYI